MNINGKPVTGSQKLLGGVALAAALIGGAYFYVTRDDADAIRLCEYAAMVSIGSSYQDFTHRSAIMMRDADSITAKVSYDDPLAGQRPGKGIATCVFLRDGLKTDPNLFDFNLLGHRLHSIELESLRTLVRYHGSYR